MKIAFVALSENGAISARHIAESLDGAAVHGLAPRTGQADVFFENTMTHLRTLFENGTAIVGLCSSGILIRAVAPLLQHKSGEPPVLAMSEDGSVVVPLLGGHNGGNRLARQIVAMTGGHAAITTASDRQLGFALDDPPPGWRVADQSIAKVFSAGLLNGEPVSLHVDAGNTAWLESSVWAKQAILQVHVSAKHSSGDPDHFFLHPPVLAIGVGCERGTDTDELQTLVAETLTNAGLSEKAVACVASIDLKADEGAVLDLAEKLDAPARFFTAGELEQERPRLQSPSEIVFRETGCHGVCEGAALAAAGPDSTLIVAKQKSKRATCAVALAPEDIRPFEVGRARGVLNVVGIGPGPAAWRSPEVTTAIRQADKVVGYGLYLDLIADIAPAVKWESSSLGKETDRVRRALDLAADGANVALVSSGDAGIFALATLVFEQLGAADNAGWNRIAVNVLPGISALQAAAARAGAPLGHDFCAVSLSDLLTPQNIILKRLEAAASGDFVTALYNPQSEKRRELLPRTKEIFLAHRTENTPVIIARNLGRVDETVETTTLSAFDAAVVDMLTLVIIGNASTRTIRQGTRDWIFTPRGYNVPQQAGQ